jgi:hypothetical protein
MAHRQLHAINRLFSRNMHQLLHILAKRRVIITRQRLISLRNELAVLFLHRSRFARGMLDRTSARTPGNRLFSRNMHQLLHILAKRRVIITRQSNIVLLISHLLISLRNELAVLFLHRSRFARGMLDRTSARTPGSYAINRLFSRNMHQLLHILAKRRVIITRQSNIVLLPLPA